MSPRSPLARALITAVALAGLLVASPVFAESGGSDWALLDDLYGAAKQLRALAYRADQLTVIPVDAEVSSKFGYRRDPINRRRKLHRGLDFDADRHTPVLSAAAGRVVTARRKGGYGRVVIIDHGNGLETRYAHLQKIKVKRGDLVPAGVEIATVGSSGRATGPHLHFEVRRKGKAIDPRRELPIDGSFDRAPGS